MYENIYKYLQNMQLLHGYNKISGGLLFRYIYILNILCINCDEIQCFASLLRSPEQIESIKMFIKKIIRYLPGVSSHMISKEARATLFRSCFFYFFIYHYRFFYIIISM